MEVQAAEAAGEAPVWVALSSLTRASSLLLMSPSRAIPQPVAMAEVLDLLPPEEVVVAASLTAPRGIRVCRPIVMVTAARERAALRLELHRLHVVTGARMIRALLAQMRRAAQAMGQEAAARAALVSISEETASWEAP